MENITDKIHIKLKHIDDRLYHSLYVPIIHVKGLFTVGIELKPMYDLLGGLREEMETNLYRISENIT